MSGNNLGIAMLPASNLTIAIPAVITTKTTASATDKADVYLSESAKREIINCQSVLTQLLKKMTVQLL